MMKHDDFFLNRSCFSMILGVVLNVKISTGIPTMIHELSRCLQRCRVFLRQAARLQTSPWRLRQHNPGSGGKPVTGLLEMIVSNIHKDIFPIFPMCPI